MKKLLIPLIFLLAFSTSLNASPWSQMLKGGIKGSIERAQNLVIALIYNLYVNR